jgi:hypothetical protein
MTRAKVSGDCRIIANNAPQASTHNRASTPNAVTNALLTDLRFAFKSFVPHKLLPNMQP